MKRQEERFIPAAVTPTGVWMCHSCDTKLTKLRTWRYTIITRWASVKEEGCHPQNRSALMARKCYWMRPKVNLSLNPSQFKEVFWVLARKLYIKRKSSITSHFNCFSFLSHLIIFAFCVRVDSSFFQMIFHKVKSHMQIQQLEAVDRRSDNFSCSAVLERFGPFQAAQTQIFGPLTKICKIKNFLRYSLFEVSVMICSRVPRAIPRPEGQYCCY